MRVSLHSLAQLARKSMTTANINQKPVLHGYAKSSCSWRVRAAFAHKNIEYDCKFYHPYDAGKDEVEAFQKLNPLGQVPLLNIDGQVLTQSIAMLEYLEETRPQQPLLPRDPFKRAQVRQIVELINSGIQPLQNPIVARRSSSDPDKQTEWQVYWIEKGLTALEKLLMDTHGTCCVGDELSFADLCLVPQLFASRRFGADLTKFPLCVKIFDDLLQMECFRKTHPNNQPDSPDESAPI